MWIFSSSGGILELRRGSQPSPWVGPGKPNLPLGLRGKAGGCARVHGGADPAVLHAARPPAGRGTPSKPPSGLLLRPGQQSTQGGPEVPLRPPGWTLCVAAQASLCSVNPPGLPHKLPLEPGFQNIPPTSSACCPLPEKPRAGKKRKKKSCYGLHILRNCSGLLHSCLMILKWLRSWFGFRSWVGGFL